MVRANLTFMAVELAKAGNLVALPLCKGGAMKKFANCSLLLILFAVQGCMAAMMLPMMAAMGMSSTKSPQKKAEASAAEARARYLENYNDYRAGMEKINRERQRRKLKPQKILSFEEWIDTLSLSPQDRQALSGPPP